MRATSESETVSARIAHFARSTRLEDVPPEVVRAAKLHLLDTLGVGLAASTQPWLQRIVEELRMLGAGQECTVLGWPDKLPAASAALLNGTFIHSLEFDDTHTRSVVHGSSVVVPTALAVAERMGKRGDELLRALVAGWEVFIRLGLAAPGAFQARGFQITSVGGVFVAALVSAMLLGLDQDETVNALGIAGSQASGVFEYLSRGATVKALHPGWAAHGGIVAAYLARAGMTGPQTILEGRYGLYRTHTSDEGALARPWELAEGLGIRWYLPEVAFKLYPCCHYIHPFLECVERLLEQGLRVEEIERVECWVPEEEVPIIVEPWERKVAPRSGYEAKFSLPYCLAVRLLGGRIDVAAFERVRDAPLLREMVSRIGYRAVANSGFPERFPAEVEVRLRSGATLRQAVVDVLGGASRPIPEELLLAKYEDNAARALSLEAVQRLRNQVEELERVDVAGELGVTLRAVKPRG